MDCPLKKWPLQKGGHCGEVAVTGGLAIFCNL